MKIVDHQPILDPSTSTYYQYIQPIQIEIHLYKLLIESIIKLIEELEILFVNSHQNRDGLSDLLSYPQSKLIFNLKFYLEEIVSVTKAEC